MLNEVDLAYAMTVHKAQGSEYRCVVLAAMPAAPSLMVRGGVLYTAPDPGPGAADRVGDDAAIRAMRKMTGSRGGIRGSGGGLAHFALPTETA